MRPAPASTSGKHRAARPPVSGKAIALAALAAIYFYGLGSGSLAMWDEALTGERSREFLLDAPWHTPFFNGAPGFNKPPLYYWLTAGVMRIAGHGEASARFFSAAFGLGCVVMTYLLGARLGRDKLAGWVAAALLALNPDWINLTRQALLDSGAMLAMLSAIFLLVRRPLSLRAAGLAGFVAALGALIKGPFTPLVFLFPLARAAFAREERRRKLKTALAGFGISILLTAPWFLLQIVLWGERYVNRYFVYSLFGRVTRTIEGHTMAPLDYLKTWWEQAPVSAAALIAAAALALLARPKARRRAALPGAALIAVALLLMLMASRRTTYLAYLYPLAALTAGILWAGIVRRLSCRARPWALGVGLALAFVFFWPQFDCRMDFTPLEKRMGRRIAKDLPEEAGLIVVDGAPNVLVFYSRPRWSKVRIDQYSATLAELFEKGAPVCRTVAPRKFVYLIENIEPTRYEHRVLEREGDLAIIGATLRAD